MGSAAWLADGSIYYLMRHSGDEDAPADLYRTRANGGVGSKVPLQPIPGCETPYLASLNPLSDTLLGAVLACPLDRDGSTIVAIDPASGRVREVADLYDGVDGMWSQTEQNGWAVYNEDGCVSIAPIDGARRRSLPRLDPSTLLPWKLDSDFSPGRDDCTARGMIGFPALAPGGSRIFALASPEAKGVAPGNFGRSREHLPWHLYELDLASRSIRRVGGEFTAPWGTVFGGSQVFVVASQHGTAGLYAVDVRNGSTRLIAKGDFGPPALSPDGRSVLLAEFPGDGPTRLTVRALP
jgi:hypothetical protein